MYSPVYGAGRDLIRAGRQEAALILKTAKAGPKPPRMLDRQPIIGLFDGSECRRCGGNYLQEYQDGHRDYHEELDAYHASLGAARDRLAYGADKDVSRRKRSTAPRRRRTSKELVGQVLELAERGLRVWPIADTLNISERRVRAILTTAGQPPLIDINRRMVEPKPKGDTAGTGVLLGSVA